MHIISTKVLLMFLTIEETGVLLKLKPSTVRRHIRNGLIPAQRLGGFNAPWRIDELKLRQTMAGLESVRRDCEAFNEGMGKSPSEQLQYDELLRRLSKLKVLGILNTVRPLLDKFGAKQLDDLHPKHYASFRAGLMRLGRKVEGAA